MTAKSICRSHKSTRKSYNFPQFFTSSFTQNIQKIMVVHFSQDPAQHIHSTISINTHTILMHTHVHVCTVACTHTLLIHTQAHTQTQTNTLHTLKFCKPHYYCAYSTEQTNHFDFSRMDNINSICYLRTEYDVWLFCYWSYDHWYGT